MLESGRLRRWILAVTCFAATLAGVSPGFAAPGDLDPSFGEGGEFAFQANPACHPGCVELAGSHMTALAMQRDGKIVLGGRNGYIGAPGGTVGPPTSLVRLNANGTLDATFGRQGLVEGPPFPIGDMRQSAVGDLFVVGSNERGPPAIKHYTEAGLPTGTFYLRGLPRYARIFAMKFDSHGRVLVVFPAPSGGIGLGRFLANGMLDRHFGVDGIAHLRGKRASEASAPAIIGEQRDGTIIVVASIEHLRRLSSPDLFFARLTPQGRPDRSFGAVHVAPVPIHEPYGPSAMEVAPDGSVALAAEQDSGPANDRHLLLVRYTPMGQLDKPFGHGGISDKVVHPVETLGRRARFGPTSITFDEKGQPVVAGSDLALTIDTGLIGPSFVARYTARGLDCSFGNGGIVFGEPSGGTRAVVMQPGGRILLAGGNRAFVAARYMGGGTPQTCAGEGRPRRRKRSSTRRSPQQRQHPGRAGARAPGA
jgi:uncharacterized delta-60 repeat protein